MEIEPKLDNSFGSLVYEIVEPHGRGGGIIVGARWVDDTRRSQTIESTKQGS